MKSFRKLTIKSRVGSYLNILWRPLACFIADLIFWMCYWAGTKAKHAQLCSYSRIAQLNVLLQLQNDVLTLLK